MTPGLRKLVLTAHITFSVGWIGAVAAFLVLAIAGVSSQNPQMMRAAYPAMELTARFVIVPLAFASLLSGLVQSLGTPWGLFRHYWVLAKLLLTTFATIVLLKKMPLIGYAARRATERLLSSADLRAAGIPLVVHAAGGILVLLVVTILSVYKPWGLTRYGQRKQEERQFQPPRSAQIVEVNAMFDPDNKTAGGGLSRGLKIFLAAGIGVFLVVVHVSMHLTSHSFHHGH
ncbi:MAG: hypothetical protein JST28_19360 [Acidobacteria bacterium]|nr:hypothetical protein [Acidobacteriota bacterium]